MTPRRWDPDNPRYPDVEVALVGQGGDAGAIIGRVREALRAAGVDSYDVAEFSRQVYAGDYTHVLRTCMSWVTVT